jgi:hypothetical protein
MSTPSWQPQVQVKAGHYRPGYDDWDKWTNYWWQIRSVIDCKAQKVLEIGVGSQVVNDYLKRAGLNVYSLDIDPALNPDYLGSATAIPLPDGSQDAILCCEVLEHMPWEQSVQTIRELHRVTNRWAFVTVPHFALSFALMLRMPYFHFREFRFRLPLFKELRPGGEHYWEIGRKGYTTRRLEREFRATGFQIVNDTRQMTNFSHCFYRLQKNG